MVGKEEPNGVHIEVYSGDTSKKQKQGSHHSAVTVTVTVTANVTATVTF